MGDLMSAYTDFVKTSYESKYYSRYEVTAENPTMSLAIPFSGDLSKVKVAVNRIRAGYIIVGEEIILNRVFSSGDLIEFYIPYELLNFIGSIDNRDVKTETVAKFLGAVCEFLVNRGTFAVDMVEGAEELIVFENQQDTLNNLFKYPYVGLNYLFTSLRNIGDLITNRAILSEVLFNLSFYPVDFKTYKDKEFFSGAIITPYETGTYGPYRGNSGGVFTKQITQDQDRAKIFVSKESIFIQDRSEIQDSKSFKQLIVGLNPPTFDSDVLEFLLAIFKRRKALRALGQGKYRLPVDFDDFFGCVVGFDNVRLDPINQKSRYLTLTEPNLDNEILDFTPKRFKIKAYSLKQGLNNLESADLIGDYDITEKYSAPVKFEINSDDNPELGPNNLGQNDGEQKIKASFPWIYDITASYFRYVPPSGFNSLFVYVDASSEKTKGTLLNAVEGTQAEFKANIRYNLRKRKVDTPLTIDIASGAFSINPFPDGTVLYDDGVVGAPNLFIRRAFFADKYGVFQVVNRTPNPRLTKDSKLLWLDIDTSISNDDMRDLFGVQVKFEENLRVILYSVYIIHPGLDPAYIYIKAPFEGSVFGGAINPAYIHSRPLNHYRFKSKFKDKTFKHPSYNLHWDGFPYVSFELSGNNLKVKIPLEDIKDVYGLRLFADTAIFEGSSEKEILLNRDVTSFEEGPISPGDPATGVFFNIPVNLAGVNANDELEIRGILYKETDA